MILLLLASCKITTSNLFHPAYCYTWVLQCHSFMNSKVIWTFNLLTKESSTYWLNFSQNIVLSFDTAPPAMKSDEFESWFLGSCNNDYEHCRNLVCWLPVTKQFSLQGHSEHVTNGYLFFQHREPVGMLGSPGHTVAIEWKYVPSLKSEWTWISSFAMSYLQHIHHCILL